MPDILSENILGICGSFTLIELISYLSGRIRIFLACVFYMENKLDRKVALWTDILYFCKRKYNFTCLFVVYFFEFQSIIVANFRNFKQWFFACSLLKSCGFVSSNAWLIKKMSTWHNCVRIFMKNNFVINWINVCTVISNNTVSDRR